MSEMYVYNRVNPELESGCERVCVPETTACHLCPASVAIRCPLSRLVQGYPVSDELIERCIPAGEFHSPVHVAQSQEEYLFNLGVEGIMDLQRRILRDVTDEELRQRSEERYADLLASLGVDRVAGWLRVRGLDSEEALSQARTLLNK
jgi:hypothetical protein